METTNAFVGEHIFPGEVGYLLSALSLVSSLVATYAFAMAYFKKEITQQKSWYDLAKIAFIIEAITVFSSFVILTYIISNHLFEYKYAYSHSDKSMPFQYLLSCFWEGQEGSFLLWSFWHCVIGLVILWKVQQNKSGLLMVISFAQVLLGTMVLGVYIFNSKIGSSPFILLRHEMSWPILSRPDYLQFIKDGTGLNTTLQNYWMVIHPPILFLGFASTIVPFAYAVIGLIRKENGWLEKEVLPWANFSAAVLGLGIMMGAAWAYESLNFGGYWAWDPVENASLVPWIVLVAGIHTNIIYRKTKGSLKATYLFYGLSFLLVVYSTFLTRSGILGDTSVHAFTDLSMNAQLLIFLLIFLLPYLVLFLFRYKSLEEPKQEDAINSREFWMLVGSLILVLAALVIIAITSIPVFNKIFGTKIAPPEDPIFAHNQVQIFVAILVATLTGLAQFLKFKSTPSGHFLKENKIPFILTAVISAIIIFLIGIAYDEKGIGFQGAIYVCVVASVYSIVGNAYYWLHTLKKKLKSAGASITHLGFALTLLGILLSSGNKTVLSWNTTGISPLRMEAGQKNNPAGNPRENITLFEGVKTDMGKYDVTYVKDSFDAAGKRYFNIQFENKKTKETFNLFPDILKNNKMEGYAANPAAKHYWNQDIFIYITSYRDDTGEDTTKFHPVTIAEGDSIFYSNGYIKLNKVLVNPKTDIPTGSNLLQLQLDVVSKEGIHYLAQPSIMVSSANMMQLQWDTVKAQNLILSFNKVVDPSKRTLEIGVRESKALTDLITLKVYSFPYINVLWIGVIIMTLGFCLAAYNRLLKKKL